MYHQNYILHFIESNEGRNLSKVYNERGRQEGTGQKNCDHFSTTIDRESN